MPVMNEEQGCGKIIPQIKRSGMTNIVVDNNSKDKTVEVCKNLGVEVINKGKVKYSLPRSLAINYW